MDTVGRHIRSLTGAHTRIAWCRQQQDVKDYTAMTPDFKLIGIDSDDGAGERIICNRTGSYCNPVITPSGARVVFTDNEDRSVYVVNWDGTGLRRIGPGYCTSTWRDPPSGIEWALIRPNKDKSWVSKSRPLARYNIDDPAQKEVVWSKSNVSANHFWLSPDGTRAACAAPWPKVGLAVVPNGRFAQFDKGCWCSIAGDGSNRVMVFQFGHRTVKIYNPDGSLHATVIVNEAPLMKEWEIYHPRWANNVRFMTVTGPYSAGSHGPCPPGDRPRMTMHGGANVELHLGRLNNELTAIEEWVQVTENESPDFFGHTWIDSQE